MKKVLFATTALVLTAGMAAAEVKLSGTGRAGLAYSESDSSNSRDTQVSLRLRFNIDASKELDSGVTLGGRIRLQYDQGDNASLSGTTTTTGFVDTNANGIQDGGESVTVSTSTTSGSTGAGAELSAAYIYAETSGFRVEVGNANTAFVSLGTLYNSELGFIGTTQGSYNLIPGYASFSSGPYSGSEADRVGIFVSYEVGGLVARFSYTTPDQTVEDLPTGTAEEYSVSVDYTSGAFSVGAGYVANSGFVDGNDGYAILGEYAINDTTNVGLQFLGFEPDVGDSNTGVTLYGNTDLNGIGLGGFISTTDEDGVENDVAYGIGASYDLGGATLAGTIQQSFDENTYADVGVSFSF